MTAVPFRSGCTGLEGHLFLTRRGVDEGAPCIAFLRPKDDDGGTMHDPGVNEQHMAYSLLPSASLFTFVSSQADSRSSPPSFTHVSLLRRITILR
ncbi:hypothetical protein BDZ89DRAFT_1080728 [Hymenopellis radicata]|nr:hypothetical protein BDZ89DRAFT_1080728 [Hymenopellis radicata]